MAELREIKGEELQGLIDSGERVLVDFYMTNCGPCSMQKMILKDLAKTTEDVQIVALNVTEEQAIVEQYEISTAPFLILFDQGKEITRLLGIQQKAVVAAALQA